MTNQPTLYMLIGMPGSGKSTWVEKHREGKIVLSTDNYIEDIAFKAGKTYNEVFQVAIAAAEINLAQWRNIAIQTCSDIIWDQTNLSKSARAKKLHLIPDNYRKVAVVFHVPEEELTRRLANRPGKTIPEHVLRSMQKSFEYPSLVEGFDSIDNENYNVRIVPD